MILEKEYLRDRAVLYARKFALERNPLYYRFEGIGGNCTNFASQCVLAGSCVMNFAAIYGWYYLSLNRRSASWTGVEFFYDFFTNNTGLGPFAREENLENAQVGDLIQLQNDAGDFYHTLVITEITEEEIYICANSNDALDRPLSSYTYAGLRVIHILGVRYDSRYVIDCFESLYSQTPIPPRPSEETEEPTSPNGEETVNPPESANQT
ncbi:MAG: amidase domain-containing protein [Oscillospiraceae bacterium]|nr:amidase domain-containing protein [Oscillospiraceae bacterium]